MVRLWLSLSNTRASSGLPGAAELHVTSWEKTTALQRWTRPLIASSVRAKNAVGSCSAPAIGHITCWLAVRLIGRLVQLTPVATFASKCTARICKMLIACEQQVHTCTWLRQTEIKVQIQLYMCTYAE